ncbi:MAG: VOC family protein [Ignavibacteriae bacterium]|nr:VOC family protein [Ignavibacteriota bacterium]
MFINEVILITDKLDELKEFYGSILGLPVRSENENSVSVRTINSVLTFTANNTDLYKNPFYHFAFNIPNNKFIEAKAWISERVNLIESGGENEFEFASWNARALYFYDPAGNILEFIARYDLDNSASGNFTGKNILNISEIGLPVRNVEMFFNKVTAEFGLPLFSGDKKNFCAVGDDNGLMIIVPEKRTWYPNLPEAGIFPVTVIIESGIKKDIQFQDLPYKIISES